VTVQELQQLFYLSRMIECETQRLDALRDAVSLKSPVLSDMPRAPGVRDKIGDMVPEIVDQEAQLRESIDRYRATRDRLLRYIDSVPNVRIKLILTLRFIQQLPWMKVAERIGGKETEYSVKHACYRYVEGRDEPAWMRNQISMFDGEETSSTAAAVPLPLSGEGT